MQPDSGLPEDSPFDRDIHEFTTRDFTTRDFTTRDFTTRDSLIRDSLIREFTFFVDAEAYGLGGYDASALAADENDLHEAGVVSVDIPTGYGSDLGDRIPIRVRATASGLRFYAKLLGIRDPMQWEELERVCSALRRPESDG